MSAPLAYRIAFSSLKGITVANARLILERVGSVEKFFEMPRTTLSALMSGKSAIYDDEVRRNSLEEAAREVEWIENNNIRAIFFTDEDYPRRLLDCDDAPLMIYSLGKVNFNATHVISIVGTRNATAYGAGFISKFIEEISRRLPDTLIVSGLAFGIDVAAHREALAHDIPTVGVLAHGLSTIYPAVHRSTAVEMVRKGGGLVTDYRHDSPIHRHHFLARNRIVAGLCDALIVVESASKGGALLTANIASAYGRDVFALPGRVTDIYSAGCNKLIITNIAAMVTTPSDFFSQMNWTPLPEEGDQYDLFPEMTSDEKSVVDYLVTNGATNINRLAIETGKRMSQMIQMLGDMEFRGILRSLPGGVYTVS